MALREVLIKRWGLMVGGIIIVSLIIILCLCWFYPRTTVMVLRHADRETNTNVPDNSVPLTPDGQTRAQTFAQVAGRAGVTAIYVTEKLRTQQTAQPLAASLGIIPTQINAANIDDLINAVLARRNRGGVIVIVGHSDTVPVIVSRLGGGAVTVGSDEFDNLFVLTLDYWGTTKIIQATYGEPRRCPVCP